MKEFSPAIKRRSEKHLSAQHLTADISILWNPLFFRERDREWEQAREKESGGEQSHCSVFPHGARTQIHTVPPQRHAVFLILKHTDINQPLSWSLPRNPLRTSSDNNLTGPAVRKEGHCHSDDPKQIPNGTRCWTSALNKSLGSDLVYYTMNSELTWGEGVGRKHLYYLEC